MCCAELWRGLGQREEELQSCAQHTIDKAEKGVKSSLFCTRKTTYGSGETLRSDILYDRIYGESMHQPSELLRIHGAELIRRAWP